MAIEDDIREVLSRHVADVRPPEGALASIEERMIRQRQLSPVRRVLIAGFALAVSAAALGLLWVVRPATEEARQRTGISSSPEVNPRVTAVIQVAASPQAIAAGAEGVWVAAPVENVESDCTGTVSRIDARTNEISTIVSVPVNPTEVAVGGGSVWVAGTVCLPGATYDGAVIRIDPETARILTTIQVGAVVFDVAVDESADEPAVWVTRDIDGKSGEVIRIDATTNSIATRIPVDGRIRSVITGIGSVWLQDTSLELPSVTRLDANTNEVIGKLPGAQAIAVGDGMVWVGGFLSTYDLSVGTGAEDRPVAVQLSPETGEIIRGPIVIPGGFNPFAVGSGGVWFAGGKGISRLNLETLDVDQSLPVTDGVPVDVELDSVRSAIWVVNYQGTITRINLY